MASGLATAVGHGDMSMPKATPRWRVAIVDDHERSRAAICARRCGRRAGRWRARLRAAPTRWRWCSQARPDVVDLRGRACRTAMASPSAAGGDPGSRLPGRALHQPHPRRPRGRGPRRPASWPTCSSRCGRPSWRPALDLAVARFRETRQLRQTLEERKVIERAKGRLMDAAQPHRGRGVPPPAPGRHEQPPARWSRSRAPCSSPSQSPRICRGFRQSAAPPRAPLQQIHAVEPFGTVACSHGARADNDVHDRGNGAARSDSATIRTQRKETSMAARTLAATSSRAAWPPAPACRRGLVGFPSIITAQGKEPVKIGVLHSLSGTMAISEVSLRDVVLMAVEEINAKGGVMGRKIAARRRRSRLELGPVRGEGQAAPAPGQGRGRLRLLDVGQPQVGAAGVREQQRPALLPGAVRGRGVQQERLLHGRHARTSS